MPRPKTSAIDKGNPIQEAIIEARFSADNWDRTSAGRIYQLLEKKFPERRDIQTFAIVFGPQSALPSLQAPELQLWTAEQNQLVQFGRGIIVANCVKYSHWNEFLPSFIELAKAYMEVVTPNALTQMSIRYINKFDFENKEIDLGKYFTCSVVLPKTLQLMNSIRLNVSSPINDDSATGSNKIDLQFFSDSHSSRDQNKSAFVLDINCVSEVQLAPKITDMKKLANWSHNKVKLVFKDFVRTSFRRPYLPEE